MLNFGAMKWIGKRISFVDDANKTTFIIYPETKTWVKGVMGSWIAMWIVIGVTSFWALTAFSLKQQEQIILFVFLVFWAYYFFRVGRSYLWLLWGKEMIMLNDTAFNYKKAIKAYGKSGVYYYENIKNIELAIPKENSLQVAWENSPWIRGGERISFEYMGKRIRFGQKLNETDTKLLSNIIGKRIAERLKKLK